MDYTLFWTAFGAIGTTLGSLITAVAVIVAISQYKQTVSKKIAISMKFEIVEYNSVKELLIGVSVTNTGTRNIIISDSYLSIDSDFIPVTKVQTDAIFASKVSPVFYTIYNSYPSSSYRVVMTAKQKKWHENERHPSNTVTEAVNMHEDKFHHVDMQLSPITFPLELHPEERLMIHLRLKEIFEWIRTSENGKYLSNRRKLKFVVLDTADKQYKYNSHLSIASIYRVTFEFLNDNQKLDNR